MQQSTAELEQSRYAQTTSELRNRQSYYSTGMPRNEFESTRLTRTSSFGQNNIKTKLETFDAIMGTLARELQQLRQDTTVTNRPNAGFSRALQESEQVAAGGTRQ